MEAPPPESCLYGMQDNKEGPTFLPEDRDPVHFLMLRVRTEKAVKSFSLHELLQMEQMEPSANEMTAQWVIDRYEINGRYEVSSPGNGLGSAMC